MKRRGVPLVLALGLLGFSAPSALAAQRYAAPAGAGSECTQAKPCSIEEAVGNAESNDEVIVAPGTYTLAAELKTPAGRTGVDIHGQAGQPAPRLVASLVGAALEVTAGNRLSQVEVVNTERFAMGITCGEGASVDRVSVLVSGQEAKAVQQVTTCAVRDSLLRANGRAATGLRSTGGGETVVARNLTLIVQGTESVGAGSEGVAPDPFVRYVHLLDLKNSIVRAEGTDLVSHFLFFEFTGDPHEAEGDIAVANSNFATVKYQLGSTVTEGPGNQRAMPIFVDAELGDYTEAAASPTVDGGVVDQLGPLDLAGRKRVQGPAPDIGAYELPSALPFGDCSCPFPIHGGIRSLSIRPKRFRPARGAVVTFTMSGPRSVEFSVSKKIRHRKAFRPLKGSFTRRGRRGENRFTFHGRIGGRTLKPGRYKLTARAGDGLVSAGFRIRARAPRGGAR
jgi:hypothetical protein